MMSKERWSQVIIILGLSVAVFIVLVKSFSGVSFNFFLSNEENKIDRQRINLPVLAKRFEHPRVLGESTAPVKLVVFTDVECPRCYELHQSMSRLVNERPSHVSYEVRHLPLIANINARESALSAECVGDIVGNNAFWEYFTYLFANRSRLKPSLYTEKASEYGVDAALLSNCMHSATMSQRLLADEQIAMSLGAEGVPFSIILYPDGTEQVIAGVVSYEELSELIAEK